MVDKEKDYQNKIDLLWQMYQRVNPLLDDITRGDDDEETDNDMIAFRAYMSSSINVSNSSFQHIAYDQTTYNIGDAFVPFHSPSSGSSFTAEGYFEVPYDGVYALTHKIRNAVSNSRQFIGVYKGTSEFARGSDITSTQQGIMFYIEAELEEGDRIRPFLWSQDAGVIGNAGNSYFCGHLIYKL